MKKLLFGGVLFFGVMMFTSVNVQAQEELQGEGEKWVCCQTWKISECVDILGHPHNGTYKEYAQFCP